MHCGSLRIASHTGVSYRGSFEAIASLISFEAPGRINCELRVVAASHRELRRSWEPRIAGALNCGTSREVLRRSLASREPCIARIMRAAACCT